MSQTFKQLTTKEMLAATDDPAILILDCRPVDAFNGWKTRGEKRGGHLPGAKSFPFKWTGYHFELQELLMNKGITTERSIVIYGNDQKPVNKMARLFAEGRYKDVSVYHGFSDEWVPDPALPLEKLERFQALVYPEWLNELLQGGSPGEYHGKRFVLCHSHYGHITDYHEGHIPGAIALDTLSLESPETWNRRSPGELKENLEQLGITHDTTVIVYGRFSFPSMNDPFPGKSAGHLGAIRCAFIMMYAGVSDVRILNGGITSWQEAGYPLSTEEVTPDPVADFGTDIPGRPELAVDVPQAKSMLASDDAELVSIRSWAEFTGKVSGYHYIKKKGRIPGAVFGNCGSDAYHMENYRNLDHTTRDYQEIQAEWEEAGIGPEKHLAFYCGTGWRGSEAFMNAYLMGWPRVSVFDGGWFEWSSDPVNPIETGEPAS